MKLSGRTNRVETYTEPMKWDDMVHFLFEWEHYFQCGTFDITLFYVATSQENLIFPTRVVYTNITIYDNGTEIINRTDFPRPCKQSSGVPASLIIAIVEVY